MCGFEELLSHVNNKLNTMFRSSVMFARMCTVKVRCSVVTHCITLRPVRAFLCHVYRVLACLRGLDELGRTHVALANTIPHTPPSSAHAYEQLRIMYAHVVLAGLEHDATACKPRPRTMRVRCADL